MVWLWSSPLLPLWPAAPAELCPLAWPREAGEPYPGAGCRSGPSCIPLHSRPQKAPCPLLGSTDTWYEHQVWLWQKQRSAQGMRRLEGQRLEEQFLPEKQKHNLLKLNCFNPLLPPYWCKNTFGCHNLNYMLLSWWTHQKKTKKTQRLD